MARNANKELEGLRNPRDDMTPIQPCPSFSVFCDYYDWYLLWHRHILTVLSLHPLRHCSNRSHVSTSLLLYGRPFNS